MVTDLKAQGFSTVAAVYLSKTNVGVVDILHNK